MLKGGGGGAGVGGKRHVAGQAGGRPLSVSFLFRTSGKVNITVKLARLGRWRRLWQNLELSSPGPTLHDYL